MAVQTLSDTLLPVFEAEFDSPRAVRIVPGVRLGDAGTLVFGYRPTWNPTDSKSSPLFAPPVSPTKTFDVAVTENPQAVWTLPVITVHDTVESLASELYRYRVMPLVPNQAGFSIPAGPLVVDDADRAAALASLGAYLGLDLTKGHSYMLVKSQRVVGAAEHEFVASYGSADRSTYLTDAALKAYEQMSRSDSQAQVYLDSFYQFGTHFVSRIEAGDTLFQVFAYAASEFAELKAAFEHDSGGASQISGLTALDYQYYTSAFNTEAGPSHGYTAAAGKVVLWSGDAKFQTSFKNKEWTDDRYAKGDSIFAAYLKPGAGADFLKQFSSVVPIAIELTPLAALMNVSTCADTAQAWHRVFKGAMLHKYGEAVQLAFETIGEFNWANLFPETTDSWMSTIATPSIDVYQERVDLSQIQLINTDAVNSFTVFAQVIQTGTGQIQVPGTKPVLAAHIIDSPDTAGVPVIQFSDDGFENLVLTCGQMYGALVLRNSGAKHRTVLDGFVYDFGAVDKSTKRFKVDLVADIHTPPGEALALRVATSLQFSLVAAESLLYSRGTNADDRRAFTTGYLLWLAAFIPESTSDPNLIQLRVQALYLARVARNLVVEGIEVPYLTYATYKDFVQSTISVAQDLSDRIREYQRQIREQKQLELTAKTAQEINDNIKKTGKLLTDYFAVSAKNQQDMAAYYGQIVSQKQKEFDKSVTDIQKLQDLLAEQQTNVNRAVEDFQKAIIEWEKQEITKFVLQVATDVFSLGTSFLIPASEIKAVASLGETAQKIQKVLNVLNALSKLAVGIDKEIKTLQGISRILSDVRSDVDMPSAREWQEFSINLDASLAGVPNEPGPAAAKASLSAAFKILVLRGQALLDARSKQRQVLLDLYYNQRLQNVNTDQANRLLALVDALHLGNTSAPDPLKIDLVGLTGQIQFQEKQVLAMLAKTLLLQDAAVQYEYLGQPTPITQFDLSTLKTVMMTQQGNILTALSQFNPPPEPVTNPIEYRINGVPVSALSGGSIYQFMIQPSVSEFFKYAMVRVNKVLLRIEGIDGSDGGQYLANLTCQASPFEDRDPQRQALSFHTVARHFGPYVYDIATGAPQFGDQTGVIEKSFTDITPFSSWLVSLPDTSTNKGIKFKAQTVNIVLTFKITALYVDPVKRLLRRTSGGMLMAAAAADPNAPTKDNLLDQMYSSQAVLKGWDAVLNLLEDPVNKFIADQHQERVKKEGPMVVEVSFCQGPFPSPEGDGSYFAVYTKVSVNLETPLLQFEQNNHDFVTVRQNITGGSITTGSKTVDANYDPAKDCNTSDPGVKWGKPKPVDVSKKPYLSGSVALGMVQGLVKPKTGGSTSTTHSVVLDFAKGSFVAQNLDVHTNNAELNLQLSNYFQTHEIIYVINTIDFSDLTTLKSLQPSSFKLNVLTTNSKKNILQVFITTDGQQRDNLTINVNEPIPDGYDNALMINTKIMFQSIFVQSFNKGATNIQVAAVDPQKDFVAWSAVTTQGTVKGTLDFGDRSDNYRLGPGGNEVVWDIKNLAFSRDRNQGVVLSYQDKKNVGFQYRQWQSGGRFGGGHWGPWQDHNVDVNVSMTGDYPILIAGQEDLQTIQISDVPPSVNVDNTDLKPTGACECNDNDLKIKVRDLLRDKIPAAIKSQMAGITFQAISVFALYNLLFPAKEFIKMDEAYVPGDLLVLGHFTKYTSQ